MGYKLVYPLCFIPPLGYTSDMKTSIYLTPEDVAMLEDIKKKYHLTSVIDVIRFSLRACILPTPVALSPEKPKIVEEEPVIWIEPEDNPYKDWEKLGSGINDVEGYEWVALKERVKPWRTVTLKAGDKYFNENAS
jgi:hypothetical protein